MNSNVLVEQSLALVCFLFSKIFNQLYLQKCWLHTICFFQSETKASLGNLIGHNPGRLDGLSLHHLGSGATCFIKFEENQKLILMISILAAKILEIIHFPFWLQHYSLVQGAEVRFTDKQHISVTGFQPLNYSSPTFMITVALFLHLLKTNPLVSPFWSTNLLSFHVPHSFCDGSASLIPASRKEENDWPRRRLTIDQMQLYSSKILLFFLQNKVRVIKMAQDFLFSFLEVFGKILIFEWVSPILWIYIFSC